MASGALRFRTPHIEELPSTHTRQAPGFAWVAVAGPSEDPSKNWGTNNRKRARASAGGQTDAQREALTARQQREIERKIKELNSDNSKDVQIPLPKKEAGSGGGARAGKTTNTKKILASGKTFAHYLDDEEAEIARTGRRDGDLEVVIVAPQRPSKTPIARRRAREGSSIDSSPAPVSSIQAASSPPPTASTDQAMVLDEEDDEAIPSLPSEAEIEALLNATPLTYNQARSAPPTSPAPPRRFCEAEGLASPSRDWIALPEITSRKSRGAQVQYHGEKFSSKMLGGTDCYGSLVGLINEGKAGYPISCGTISDRYWQFLVMLCRNGVAVQRRRPVRCNTSRSGGRTYVHMEASNAQA